MLLVGQIVSTLISSLGVIFVARFLGSVDYGEVALVMIPVNVVILFQGIGVDQAMTRFLAKYRVEGRTKDLEVITAGGLSFCVVVSLVSAALLWLSSDWLARNFLRDEGLVPLLNIAVLAVVGNTLLTTTQCILVGYERMSLRVVTTVSWSVVKSFLAPFLVWLGLGPYGAVLGNNAGLLVVGIFSLVLLVVFVTGRDDGSGIGLSETLKMLLVFGLPLYLANLLGGGLQQLYNSLMAIYVDVGLIGNYNAAVNFGVLVTVFTGPIATALYPLFSKMRRGDKGLRVVFQSSVKYTALITLPVAAGLILLADPVVGIVYGSDYVFTAFYLKLYLVAFLFSGLGSLSVNSLFNGVGETHQSLNMNIFTLLVGVPMALLLIPCWGVVGLLVTMLVAPRVGLFYGLWWIRREFGFSVETRSSVMIYFSAFTAFLAGFAVMNLVRLSNWAMLLVVGLVFAAVYLFLLPLSGALTAFDLREFESMSGGLGPLRGPIRLFVVLMRRLVRE